MVLNGIKFTEECVHVLFGLEKVASFFSNFLWLRQEQHSNVEDLPEAKYNYNFDSPRTLLI